MLKSQFKFIITILLTLGLSISFQSLLAQWVPPSTTPPGNNVAEPINSGSYYQKKGGPLDVLGAFGADSANITNSLTVGANINALGTIFTNNMSASTTGLNLDSGLYGMEFNIDSDGSGSDNYIYKINGVEVMTVSPSGDLLVNQNVYSSGDILATANSVASNYYSKPQIDSDFYPKTDIYTKTEVDAIASALRLASSSSFDLYLGLHSSSQCTSLGGTVVTFNTDKFCQFSGSSWPAGWIHYQNLGSTYHSSCNGNVYSECSGGTSCTTGEHSFSNIATETCSFHKELATNDYEEIKDGSWGYVLNCHPYLNTPCSATVTSVGCY